MTSLLSFSVCTHCSSSKPGSRPITAPEDPSLATVVADSRVVVYDSVKETHKLWIKGRDFSIAQLIADKVAARPWANGAVASFRLSPQDYHRYHSPVRGIVKWWKQMDGDYYLVGVFNHCRRFISIRSLTLCI